MEMVSPEKNHLKSRQAAQPGGKSPGDRIVRHNAISGTLPAGLGSLVALQVILLWRNHFHGTLPPISSFSSLLYLNIGDNYLSGKCHVYDAE